MSERAPGQEPPRPSKRRRAAAPAPLASKRKPAARKAKGVKAGVAPGRGGAARGTGKQPPFIPTNEQREEVKRLVACGYGVTEIALRLRVPVRTTSRHFQEELKNGRALVQMDVALGIINGAMKGDRTLMIYYSKAQMGWRDGYRVGFEDKDRNPVNPANLFTVNIT